MVIRNIKSDKKCKDCGDMAYSYQIGWKDESEKIHWHKPKNCNQCENCRKIMYKKIEETKKANREASFAEETS